MSEMTFTGHGGTKSAHAALRAPTTDQSLPATGETSRLAGLLRWLGAGAVAWSAVIFLLQGMENMEAVIRNWSYLLLMAVLTVAGVATRAALDDARSARLLLGLAVALVPIQFAQLGGMIHTLATGEAGVFTGLMALHASSASMILAVAAATLVLAPLAAFAGFAVLTRPAARTATFMYMLPSALLLLPWRESVGGFIVLAVLGILAVVLDRLLAATDRYRFATGEGRAVRAMFLIPLAIGAVRLGFHVEALAGHCALAGFASLALAYAARNHVHLQVCRELLYMTSALTGSLAWSAWSGAELGGGGFAIAWMLVPVAGIFLAVGRLSGVSGIYRGFAAGFAGVAALSLLAIDGMIGTVTALTLGGALLFYGCLRRECAPSVAGAAITVAAIAMLAVEAVAHVEVNTWAALASAGVLLVVLASVVERFGRSLAARARAGWEDFNQWD